MILIFIYTRQIVSQNFIGKLTVGQTEDLSKKEVKISILINHTKLKKKSKISLSLLK